MDVVRAMRSADHPRVSKIAGTIILLALVGAGGWAGSRWLRMPAPSGLALPDKPSVAVLPFTNLSQDPAQEYFSDGVTEDLITGLSKVSGLFVIARNSVFTYKGKAVKVGEVGRDLGVRYVLQGGIQREGNRVRITAQLVDAGTDTTSGPSATIGRSATSSRSRTRSRSRSSARWR
jgi:TolB-like protein